MTSAAGGQMTREAQMTMNDARSANDSAVELLYLSGQ